MKIQIIFDGGSIGNGRADSQAYGSFLVLGVIGKAPVRLQFPELRTNNEAEMQTAIEALLFAARSMGSAPQFMEVELFGDSQIAVNCLSGRWRVKKQHLRPLRDRFQALARQFKSVTLTWKPRRYAVAALGH